MLIDEKEFVILYVDLLGYSSGKDYSFKVSIDRCSSTVNISKDLD